MESGLEDRNNDQVREQDGAVYIVSMESGLEDRNNLGTTDVYEWATDVSMESGLEDRNNMGPRCSVSATVRSSQWSPA